MKKYVFILVLVVLAAWLNLGDVTAQGDTSAGLQIEKTVTDVYEPGGEATFTIRITNHGEHYVEITSLVDDVYGDLDGVGSCSLPQVIPTGWTYECSFVASITGNAGVSETDTVIAEGCDEFGNPVSATGSATVIIKDVHPQIAVVKSAEPSSLPEPGGLVTFTVTVQNNSVTSDPLTLTSLVDSVYGDLDGRGTCDVPQTIPPGGSYTCSFSAQVSGEAGDSEMDVVTASGSDDEGNTVSASDDATVTITPRSLYRLYFPFASSGGAVECAFQADWQVTVGYEDLPTESDYDYNDWVAEIIGRMTYDPAADCNLTRIDFQIDPKARGAKYDHAFHILIPANTFTANGVASLTIYDQNDNVLSAVQRPFSASQVNDYLIFAHTKDVLPGMANVIEGQAFAPPQQRAVLSIEFASPIAFDPTKYDYAAAHGTGLFFDPYLHILNWNGFVHRGDFKMLTSPELNWKWPGERYKIWSVYTTLVYQPGPPESIIFPPNWWLTYNACVYGDGVACPLPSAFYTNNANPILSTTPVP